MKILTIVLAVALIAAIGGGAYFYLAIHQPLATENAALKEERPQLDRARTDLKKLKDRESRESAWLIVAAAAMSTGLADEIKAGAAEVITAGNKVVVQIAEQVLYQPSSYTFTREAQQPLLKLTSLLRSAELKGKLVLVGNTTHAVPAQGKGRKKIPAKDARTLAADRSAALIRHFEKNGVDPDMLVSAAFTAKGTGLGQKVKDRMIVIVIETPPAAAAKQEPAPVAQAAPAPAAATAPTKTAPAP